MVAFGFDRQACGLIEAGPCARVARIRPHTWACSSDLPRAALHASLCCLGHLVHLLSVVVLLARHSKRLGRDSTMYCHSLNNAHPSLPSLARYPPSSLSPKNLREAAGGPKDRLPIAVRSRNAEHRWAGRQLRERKRASMSQSLDASLSVFVNLLGVVVFASITLYHVVTANRKDMGS